MAKLQDWGDDDEIVGAAPTTAEDFGEGDQEFGADDITVDEGSPDSQFTAERDKPRRRKKPGLIDAAARDAEVEGRYGLKPDGTFVSPQAEAKFNARLQREQDKPVTGTIAGRGEGPEVVETKPYKSATADESNVVDHAELDALKLNPQEKNLYDHHLRNLLGTGKVMNDDGSVSTIRNITVEREGRTYVLPTVWDGKLLEPHAAMQRAGEMGWDKWPSYATEDEANKRYDEMHGTMERDVLRYDLASGKDQSSLFTDLKAGWYQLRAGMEAWRLAGALEDKPRPIRNMPFNPEKQQAGIDEDIASAVASGTEFRNKGKALPQSPAATLFNNSRTFGEAWRSFWRDPYSVSRSTVAQSATSSLPSVAGSIIGASLGPAGSSIGAGAGSYYVEMGSNIESELSDRGAKLDDADSIRKVWAEHGPEILKKARIRAGVVAAFDAATAGVGSKLAEAEVKGAARKIANAIVATGVQAGGGMGGEFAAEVGTGEQIQPGAILAEGLGEVVPGAAETAGQFGVAALKEPAGTPPPEIPGEAPWAPRRPGEAPITPPNVQSVQNVQNAPGTAAPEPMSLEEEVAVLLHAGVAEADILKMPGELRRRAAQLALSKGFTPEGGYAVAEDFGEGDTEVADAGAPSPEAEQNPNAVNNGGPEADAQNQPQGDGTKNKPINVETEADIAAARPLVGEPTPGQAEAGNYQHVHLKVGNLDVAIETPKGAVRKSKPDAKEKWEVTMPVDYGRIKGTTGLDGDEIDISIGPEPIKSGRAVIIGQKDLETGKLDEYKTFVGVKNVGQAEELYEQSFSDGRGPARILSSEEMDISQFEAWVDAHRGKKAKSESDLFDEAVDEQFGEGDAEVEDNKPENLADIGKAGGAIVDNMYSMLWQKVEKGDVTELGKPTALLQAAKKVRDAGGLKTKEEFHAFAEDYAVALVEKGKTFNEQMWGLVNRHLPKKPETPPGQTGQKPDKSALSDDEAQALFDEAQAIMAKLPNDIGKKYLQQGKPVPPEIQKRIDRLDEIEKTLPQSGEQWRRLWNKGRAEYDAKLAGQRSEHGAKELAKLKDRGFAIGDKVEGFAASMLGPIGGSLRMAGTVRQRKDGSVYIAGTNGKQYSPYDSRWKKAEPETPPQAGKDLPAKGERRLKDMGDEPIDGYDSDRDDGRGAPRKTEYLADARGFLKDVAKRLEEHGYHPYTTTKGKKGNERTEDLKPVTVSEGGPAVSGDVYLDMTDGENGINVQVTRSSLHGGKATAFIVRTQDPKNRGKTGQNRWLTGNETVDELVNSVISLRDRKPADVDLKVNKPDAPTAEATKPSKEPETSTEPAKPPQNITENITEPDASDIFDAAVNEHFGDPVERLRKKTIVFSSGMSRRGDMEAGAVWAGLNQRGIGVDIGELSAEGMNDLAEQIAEKKQKAFVDSGAFSKFRATLRQKAKIEAQGESAKVEALDFDAVMGRFDALADKIGEANVVEDQDVPLPLFVMPDVVGDQAASIELAKQYARDISLWATTRIARPILPIQKGEFTLAQVYKELVGIVGSDNFITGIPSNEKAVSLEELTEFLKEAKPKGIHFLGAAAEKRVMKKLEAVAASGHEPEHVSFDANILRGALYGSEIEATRGEAIQQTLRDRAAGEIEQESLPPGERKGSVKSAGQSVLMGLDDVAKGLQALFNDPDTIGMAGAFNDETYAKALPLFRAAIAHFKDAGSDIADVIKALVKFLGEKAGLDRNGVERMKPYVLRFIDDMKAGKEPPRIDNVETNAVPEPAKPTVTPGAKLAQDIASQLEGNNDSVRMDQLLALAESAYGGTMGGGKFDRKDLYDAIETGINLYIQKHKGDYATAGTLDIAKEAARDLRQITNRFPTQTVRTQEQIEFQQFSTPPDFGFALAWIANLRWTDAVLEPSAGTGNILVHAIGSAKTTYANELSERRADLVRELHPTKVFTEDAEQLNNILPADVKPTVVLMNPPFSQTAGRMGDKKDLMVAARHIEQALKRLTPGGRLVAIVGGGTDNQVRKSEGMSLTSPTYRDWFTKIRSQYQLRANVLVSGDVYTKNGTSFRSRVLVIDKLAPEQRDISTGVVSNTEPVSNIPQLLNMLKGVRDERQPANVPAPQPVPSAEQSSEASTGEGERGAAQSGGPVPDGSGAVGAGAGSDGQPTQSSGESGAGATGKPNRRPRPGAGPKVAGEQSSGTDGAGTGSQSSPGNRRSGDTAEGSANSSRGNSEQSAPAPTSDVGIESLEQEAHTGDITENIYEPYKPERLKVAGAQPHPGPLVQSAAMASVSPPAPTYKPNLPKEVIESGKLSGAQLEAVVYAGQSHSQFLPSAEQKEGEAAPTQVRRGFFIGDGTGVGKGAEIAGIILDNWRQGRTKAVWITEKGPLINDAKRDWTWVGGDGKHIFDARKTPMAQDIKADRGIAFMTYDTLKSGMDAAAKAARGGFAKGQKVKISKTGEIGTIDRAKPIKFQGHDVYRVRIGDAVEEFPSYELTSVGERVQPVSRLDQMVKWLGEDFEGVIAFDEAHNMANGVAVRGDRGIQEASQKALGGIDLQRRLPKARVVYVSATGATEVENLAYTERLGLWGRGTAFATIRDFLGGIAEGGISAMELIARDMKALGLYIARNLSFDGVEYDRLEHTLNPAQREIYDEVAVAWQVVLENITKALEVTGATPGEENPSGPTNKQARSSALSAFWGAHQRFFNQVITSMQMPSVLAAVRKDVESGKQVVLQLVNTNEAATERAVTKAQEAGEDLEDLDLTPRDQLIGYLEKAFPVQQFEDYVDENGNTRSRPVYNSAGEPVLNAEAVALRDEMIARVQSIRVPHAPLDLLINEFGTDMLAEVTGRGRRFVKKRDEHGQLRTVEEKRPGNANVAEAEAFQEGKKKILVFSNAGGTGRSYHADNKSASKGARRVHYLVQAGWRADIAVQGFGRTHRTNQASAPIFRLVTTDLKGQKRFISSIARRLAQLGALTKGQRQAGDQGAFSAKDNLESSDAREALELFYRKLAAGELPNVYIDDFEKQTGLRLRSEQGHGALREDLPPIQQFLNRLLSMTIDMQNLVFEHFEHIMEGLIERKRELGLLDIGLQTLRADKIEKASEQVVYTHPESGAETKHVKLKVSEKTKPRSWEDIKDAKQFVRSVRHGHVYALFDAKDWTNPDGSITHTFRQVGTVHSATVAQDKIANEKEWTVVPREQAQAAWEEEVKKTPEFHTRDVHMITGTVLPIWDRLRGSARIMRAQTQKGERFLGRIIDNDQIAATLQRLGVNPEAEAMPTKDVLAAIVHDGKTAELANGWKITRRTVAGEDRIEIIGPQTYSESQQVVQDGAMREYIQSRQRLFIPTGDNSEKVFKAITKFRPVVALDGAPVVTQSTDGDVKAQRVKRPQAALMPFVGPNGTVKMTLDQAEQFGEDIAKIAKRMFGRWVPTLDFIAEPRPEGGTVVEATFDRRTWVMMLALRASQDPRFNLRHEGIHLLRAAGVFSKGEWATLARIAKNKWIKQYQIFERYNEAFGAMDASEEQILDLMIEEAVAEAFRDYATRGRIGSASDAIFEKLKRFLEAVANLLRGRGFNSVDQIFDDIEAGKFGERDTINDDTGVWIPRVKRLPGLPRKQSRIDSAQRQIGKGTPEFRKWFEGSKVVDENGDPLRVYHATPKDFSEFRAGGDDVGKSGPAIWFGTNPMNPPAAHNTGRRTGKFNDGVRTIPVYLRIRFPLIIDGTTREWAAAVYGADVPHLLPAETVEKMKEDGYDGVLYYSRADVAPSGRVYSPSKLTEAVVFEPNQIKSAVSNQGTFDSNNPDIRAQRVSPGAPSNPSPTAGQSQRRRIMQRNMGFQPIDRAFRIPFDFFGGLNQKGEWNPGAKLTKRAEHVIRNARFDNSGRFSWANPWLHKARAGLIDRYGLDENYIDRDRQRKLQERALLNEVPRILKLMTEAGVGSAEAEGLQAILTGEALPEERWDAIAEPIRQAIDQMGLEAVELGLISEESYLRNKGAYLHRVYKKHEGDTSQLAQIAGKLISSRRKRLIGDEFKGRGLFKKVPLIKIGQKPPKNGAKFNRLELKASTGRIRKIMWLAEGEPYDTPEFEDFELAGSFEVRGFSRGRVILWRDWTKPERVRMGEIIDARYTVAKTYMLMAHDLSVGRFYRDISMNPDWTTDTEPPTGTWMEAGDIKRSRVTPEEIEWVRVPDTKIPASRTKRYAALAGKYVRAEIWRDLHELELMQRTGVWSEFIKQWKLNKTARSPVVHMNNIMSNFMLMDASGVGATDLARAVRSMATKDADYLAAVDAGAFGVDMATHEIRQTVLNPILRQLNSTMPGTGGGFGLMSIVSHIANGLFSKSALLGAMAGFSFGGAPGAVVGAFTGAALRRPANAIDDAMLRIYQTEDEVFRMALFHRRRAQGLSPQEAADEARAQFIDYDIRAPWINMARRTVLPFLAYTYRAGPMMARTLATRPWKVAKYATMLFAAQALAGVVLGGDDDDEDDERRSMNEEDRGWLWMGPVPIGPRKVRLPLKDDNGNTVYIDARRWMPAGDIFDTQQGQAGIFSPLNPSGPIMMGAEILLNKQSFNGKEIYNDDIDDFWDRQSKKADWAWKGFMPSAAWIPDSWYWEKIANAWHGASPAPGEPPYDLSDTLLSSVGIKLKGQDVEEGQRFKGNRFDWTERQLKMERSRMKKLYARKVISQEEFDKMLEDIMEKLQLNAEGKQRMLTGE